MKIRVMQFMIMVSLCGLVFTGCNKEEVKNPPTEENKGSIMENSEEYAKAKVFIKDYFKELFKPEIEIHDMHKRSYFGEIPENMHSFIDEGVISEGLNSPDIPIHLPRFIELNGYTIIGYNIMEKDDEPMIDVKILEEDGENTKYFTKIEFVVNVLKNIDFDLHYKKEAEQEYYNKVSDVPAEKIDNMKIRLKYDVALKKQDDDFKVISEIETDIKSDNKYRVTKINNDFVDRLNYLDLSLGKGNIPVNGDDIARFTAETDLIKGFFENMLKLDKIRMNYVEQAWELGKDEFNQSLLKYNIQTITDEKPLILIDDDYKTKFSIEKFILQDGMVKIKNKTNIDIKPHPSYTQKVNNYIVSVGLVFEKMSGASNNIGNAEYVYYVELSIKDDALVISSFNLVEFLIQRKDNTKKK